MKIEFFHNGQPHFQHIGATFCVTMMVHDAVPKAVFDQVQEAYQIEIRAIEMDDRPDKSLRKAQLSGEYEFKLEQLLHAKSTQEHPFLCQESAQCLMEKIKDFDGRYYNLIAACVMSIHAHILVDFSTQVPETWDGLSEIPGYLNLAYVLGRIKGGTTFSINKMLGRNGTLWMPSYYDRYIRSNKHLVFALNYIIQNPVKAGIVEDWQEYPFTYLHSDYPQLGLANS